MKTQITGTIDVNGLKITGLKIGKHNTDLEIEKWFETGLMLRFSCGFQIKIDSTGAMSFTRTVLRPNHDHNDSQDFCCIAGVPQWHYRQESLQIDFGPVKVDY